MAAELAVGPGARWPLIKAGKRTLALRSTKNYPHNWLGRRPLERSRGPHWNECALLEQGRQGAKCRPKASSGRRRHERQAGLEVEETESSRVEAVALLPGDRPRLPAAPGAV